MDRQIVDFVRVIVLAFVALFPVVNPVGGAPIFLSLTGRYPPSAQKVLARKIAVYGFALLAVSLVLGSEILAFFGITLYVVQIAGGLVVAFTGWTLLNQPETDADSTEKQTPATLEDALAHAFFPLTLPITVGPGSLSIAVTIGAHLRSQAGPGFIHGYPWHLLAALGGMFLVCLLVVPCYGNADVLEQKLGKSGTNILARLSAFIVLAIGIQIVWSGLSSGLPELLTHPAPH